MSLLKNQHLFFLLAVPFLPVATPGYDIVLYQKCENFTQNYILQTNINSLITDMKAQASLQRFAISTSGVGYDAVYGIARCQGDMSHDECSACIDNAAEKIQAECPVAAKGRVWSEKCFLHYDTSNFIDKPDLSYARMWVSSCKADNPKAFEQVVAELMAEVMARAARERRFSSGENFLKNGGGVTVYGMAQCTQDLEEPACNQCLKISLEIMAKDCVGQNGCRIFGNSCVLRYEIYKFLANAEVYAPAPAPSMEVYS